jgi:hypothetical protein
MDHTYSRTNYYTEMLLRSKQNRWDKIPHDVLMEIKYEVDKITEGKRKPLISDVREAIKNIESKTN